MLATTFRNLTETATHHDWTLICMASERTTPVRSFNYLCRDQSIFEGDNRSIKILIPLEYAAVLSCAICEQSRYAGKVKYKPSEKNEPIRGNFGFPLYFEIEATLGWVFCVLHQFFSLLSPISSRRIHSISSITQMCCYLHTIYVHGVGSIRFVDVGYVPSWMYKNITFPAASCKTNQAGFPILGSNFIASCIPAPYTHT